MFHFQLAAFAVLAILAGTSLAGWGAGGQFEWETRCGVNAIFSDHIDQYVCFGSSFDVTKSTTEGDFEGYAKDGGTGFALIKKAGQNGTVVKFSDRRISIRWYNAYAHVRVEKLQRDWVTTFEDDINIDNLSGPRTVPT